MCEVELWPGKAMGEAIAQSPGVDDERHSADGLHEAASLVDCRRTFDVDFNIIKINKASVG